MGGPPSEDGAFELRLYDTTAVGSDASRRITRAEMDAIYDGLHTPLAMVDDVYTEYRPELCTVRHPALAAPTEFGPVAEDEPPSRTIGTPRTTPTANGEIDRRQASGHLKSS